MSRPAMVVVMMMVRNLRVVHYLVMAHRNRVMLRALTRRDPGTDRPAQGPADDGTVAPTHFRTDVRADGGAKRRTERGPLAQPMVGMGGRRQGREHKGQKGNCRLFHRMFSVMATTVASFHRRG